MKKSIVCAGRIAAIISILYILFEIWVNYNEFTDFQWNVDAITYILLFVFYCCFNILISALIWTLLLRRTGVEISFVDGYIIFGLSQIGKYLPGNIFHYAGRAALGNKKGIPLNSVIFSIGAETILVLGATVLIALFGITAGFQGLEVLSFLPIDFPKGELFLFPLLFLGGAWVFRGLIKRLFPNPVSSFTPMVLICSFLAYLGAFLGYGIFIFLLSKGIGNINTDLNWFHFAWGFSIAWVVGFLVPGAPGGVGIREAMLVGIWGGELGAGIALSLVIFLRIITSLGDLVSFAIAYSLRSFYAPIKNY